MPGLKNPILADDQTLFGGAFNTGKNIVRGLYYFRARQYHPTQGRFMQRDPIGMWGDPMNLGNPYAYCTNNPTSLRDPSGLAIGFVIDALFIAYDTYEYATGQISGAQYSARMALNGVSLLANAATGGMGGYALRAAQGLAQSGKAGSAVIRGARAIDMAQTGIAVFQAGVSLGEGIQTGDWKRAGLSTLQMGFAFYGARKSKSNELPDDAFVVRGGTNTSKLIEKGTGIHPEIKLKGFSVESAAGKTVKELAESPTVRQYGQIGVTTVGDVRRAGGNVFPSSGRSPFHATVTGLDPETASKLLTPTIRNPVKGN